MPKLPILTGREIVKVFLQLGWIIAKQRGSHIILVKAQHNATLAIPDHKEVAQGTLRGLIKAAGLSVDEFIAMNK